MNPVASFTVEYVQILDAEGRVATVLPSTVADPDAIVAMYRAMTLTRVFDAKAIALQRTGQLGTFASSLGQEAVGVGVASAMRSEDVLLPSYREHGAQFLRGVSMVESLLYWSGDERGSNFARARHDFPNCVPIGTQAHHAAGVAYAFKLRREPRAAVCLIGDGGTSRGDFYEGMNFAGVNRLPVVFVINNNQWAISVPRARQSAAQTLAQKAIAAGIEGIQVDGNDVIAVRHVASQAIERARSGSGPSVVEAITYRLGDHTTADDATRYRNAETVAAQWKREPIARLRHYLNAIGQWDREKEDQLMRDCTAQVNAAVDAYLATPMPSVEAMFEHLYETLPEALLDQRAEAVRFAQTSKPSHG